MLWSTLGCFSESVTLETGRTSSRLGQCTVFPIPAWLQLFFPQISKSSYPKAILIQSEVKCILQVVFNKNAIVLGKGLVAFLSCLACLYSDSDGQSLKLQDRMSYWIKTKEGLGVDTDGHPSCLQRLFCCFNQNDSSRQHWALLRIYFYKFYSCFSNTVANVLFPYPFLLRTPPNPFS